MSTVSKVDIYEIMYPFYQKEDFIMNQFIHAIRAGEWSQIIRERNAGGLTKKEWCLQNHINEKLFYYWQHVIRRETLTFCQ